MVKVVHIEELSGRSAKYAEIPSQLSENMKFALERVGITRLYSHQVRNCVFSGNEIDPSYPVSFLACA